MNNCWLVYIIEAGDGSLYTGITTDMLRRWREHRGGRGAKYFRGRAPKALRYLERGHDRCSAGRREAAIKRLTRAQKFSLIASDGSAALVLVSNWEELV
jgi:putative endonuclease